MRVVMHPAFTLQSYNYDLAILTLKSSFYNVSVDVANNNFFVQVIQISNQEPKDHTKLLVTGWGQTASVGPISIHLLRAELIKMNHSECVQRWTPGQPVTDNMFCALSKQQSCCMVR